MDKRSKRILGFFAASRRVDTRMRTSLAVALLFSSVTAVNATPECSVSNGTLTIQFKNAGQSIQHCTAVCRVAMNDGGVRQVSCEADAPSNAVVTACKREMPKATSATLLSADCKPKEAD